MGKTPPRASRFWCYAIAVVFANVGRLRVVNTGAAPYLEGKRWQVAPTRYSPMPRQVNWFATSPTSIEISLQTNMASRHHIVDGLYRCLCPQFNNLLASKSAVAQFRPRNLSTLASVVCFPATRPTHQSVYSVPEPVPQTPPPEPQDTLPPAEDTNEAPSALRIRKINSLGPSWNKPINFDRKQRPFIRRNRPTPQGIEKVEDLAHRGAFPEVFDEARALVERGYKPDRELYAALIYACSNFPGCLMQDLAFDLVGEMKGRGIQPNTEIYHHLLKLLATSPDYLKRTEVLKEMKDSWQTVSDDGWQWVIAGYLMGGNLELALGIIGERREKGLVVHQSTYEHAIYRLCAVGEAEEALRIAKMLDDEGFWKAPAKVVYDLLVVGTKQMHVSGCHSYGRICD